MEEMTSHMSNPHTTPEKLKVIPDMHDDNLETCMTKTQELFHDMINNLVSTTEKLTK